jgi:hypothetical protein
MVIRATRATTPRMTARAMVALLKAPEPSDLSVSVSMLTRLGILKALSVPQQLRLLWPQQYVPSEQGVISTVPLAEPPL